MRDLKDGGEWQISSAGSDEEQCESASGGRKSAQAEGCREDEERASGFVVGGIAAKKQGVSGGIVAPQSLLIYS
jgi:hypothetical protein